MEKSVCRCQKRRILFARYHKECRETFVILISCIIGILVLVIGDVDALSPVFICSRIPGLSSLQQSMCREQPAAMISVGLGAELALSECHRQFVNTRWNCRRHNQSALSYMSNVGTRESAFVSAIRAAGIAFSMTQACMQGNLTNCGCARMSGTSLTGRLPQDVAGGSWKWSGCSADINYGTRFSKEFFDDDTGSLDPVKVTIRHNNRAGRKVLRESSGVNCKCVGVSGSCSIRTCWVTLPTFRTVADRLATLYPRAKQVEPTYVVDHSTARTPSSTLSLRVKRQMIGPPSLSLVYLDRSPDYCLPDGTVDSTGTRGRDCNRTSATDDGCYSMCCGRGFDTHRFVTNRKCNCKFNWCCHVTCQRCTDVTEESVCR